MKQLVSFLFYTLFIAFPLWLIGFVLFILYVFSFQHTNTPSAQAIVAWTGGEYRVQTALNLLEQNKAQQLLISGINKSVSATSVLGNVPQELKSRIYLGYQATTTQENASETADWVYKNGFNTLILVTSFYHMPRSLLEFKHVLPHTTVYPYAIWPKDFTESVEWIHTRSAFHLLVEYHKFLFVKTSYLWEELFR